jgi:hypothetical protein
MARFRFSLALALSACGGSPLQGGNAELPEDAPRGRLALRMLPTNCRDGAGQPTPPVPTRIEVVQLANDQTVVLERRPGYDVLVVTNAFRDQEALVFQAVMKPTSAPDRDMLREFRLWQDGGVLRVADRWQSEDLPGRRFKATFSRPILQCALTIEATGA